MSSFVLHTSDVTTASNTYRFWVSDVNLTGNITNIFMYYPGTSSWIDITNAGSSTNYTFSTSFSAIYAIALGYYEGSTIKITIPVLIGCYNYVCYRTGNSTMSWSMDVMPNEVTINTDFNITLRLSNDGSQDIPWRYNVDGSSGTLTSGNYVNISVPSSTKYAYRTVTITPAQSSYTVTAQNTQNMKQIQVGSTVYSSFPASIPITGNTTLQCSGEDDKTITVNYTNTSVPVITDTQ